MRILLVEDDEVVGEISAALLVGKGHTTVVTTTVTDAALLLAGSHDFDAVLLDLGVGTERGDELVLRLRAQKVSLPPIILYSAQPMDELRRSADVIQAAAIIQKPCRIHELVTMIEGAVNGEEITFNATRQGDSA